MSLLIVAELRALVKTPLSDSDLQTVLDREEALMVDACGANYSATVGFSITEMLIGGLPNLWLGRKIGSVVEITENDETDPLSTDDYRLWGNAGRIQRLPEGYRWPPLVEVEYVPQDDSPLRRSVIADLVRLTLERTALKSEQVAGEYGYTASDWDKERAQMYRKLRLIRV